MGDLTLWQPRLYGLLAVILSSYFTDTTAHQAQLTVYLGIEMMWGSDKLHCDFLSIRGMVGPTLTPKQRMAPPRQSEGGLGFRSRFLSHLQFLLLHSSHVSSTDSSHGLRTW